MASSTMRPLPRGGGEVLRLTSIACAMQHTNDPEPRMNWTRGQALGQGAFGAVFLARDNDRGTFIAVKQVRSLAGWRRVV